MHFFISGEKKKIIKVATRITDYCETCSDLSQRNDTASQQALSAHRLYAHEQREHYKRRISESRKPDSKVLHLTMDFAENVYLPYQHRQASQRFFLTGLKFDLFGISNDSFPAQVIYGLTEGHWPNEKTANTVCSMLNHFLHTPAFVHGNKAAPLIMRLTADNCTGQNKNRWIIWYLSFLTIIGRFDEIDLSFLVSGHTKNMCDARFALVKRSMRSKEALIPAHMHDIISCSSLVLTGVKASEVGWYNWKSFLEGFFCGTIKNINSYHFFKFKAAQPGVVFCSTSCDAPEQTVIRHQLLKNEPDILMKLRAEQSNIPLYQFVDFTAARRAYVEKELLERYFSQDNVNHLRASFLHA